MLVLRIIGTICLGVSYIFQLAKNKFVFNWVDGTKGAYVGTCLFELVWRALVVATLWLL